MTMSHISKGHQSPRADIGYPVPEQTEYPNTVEVQASEIAQVPGEQRPIVEQHLGHIAQLRPAIEAARRKGEAATRELSRPPKTSAQLIESRKGWEDAILRLKLYKARDLRLDREHQNSHN